MLPALWLKSPVLSYQTHAGAVSGGLGVLFMIILQEFVYVYYVCKCLTTCCLHSLETPSAAVSTRIV